MIAVIDYGAGNLFSVCNALEYLNIPHIVTKNPDEIKNAKGIILPGVGAFPAAMQMLKDSGLIEILISEAKKKPFLGICLGMQLLFDKSDEFEECQGLGLIPGEIHRIPDHNLVIPHMGWNHLDYHMNCPLLDTNKDTYVYFIHSYQAFCDAKYIAASAEYGETVPALVTDGAYVYGAQFHPEKSGTDGLNMLARFGGLCQ